ncbi:MAG TPA: hypothetical protein VFB99_15295 [Vicinamibacterales bacterium]|nr:hypothetical protein [Vicinamibacterales bacterium]
MTRAWDAVRLMLLSLGLVPIAAVPDQSDVESDRSSTRVDVEKEGRSTRVVVQTAIPIEVELPAQTTAQCDATLALEYTQRDTLVRVEGSIENGTCAASSGDYTIAVSFRDETGELKTLEFRETWQRSDDRPVEFSTDYKIGENVDLVGVRSRRLRCECADTAGD